MRSVPTDWIALAANLILVGVTGWYAWLTKRLAQSGEASANSAKEAAEAASDAVKIQRASLAIQRSLADVKLIVQPGYGLVDPEGGAEFAGFTMQAGLSGYVIHQVTLRSIGFANIRRPTERRAMGVSPQPVEPLTISLPAVLQGSDRWSFLIPEANLWARQLVGDGRYVVWMLTIDVRCAFNEEDTEGRTTIVHFELNVSEVQRLIEAQQAR